MTPNSCQELNIALVLCPNGDTCCGFYETCTLTGCCPSGSSTCGNDGCCPRGKTCVGSDGCCDTGLSKCPNNNGYCYEAATEVCCADKGSCPKDSTCCGSGCCESGTTCAAGACVGGLPGVVLSSIKDNAGSVGNLVRNSFKTLLGGFVFTYFIL